MLGWCEITPESKHHLKIAYSIGEDASCNGEVLYDQMNEEFILVELATGATLMDTRYFVEGLRQKFMVSMPLWQKSAIFFPTMYPLPYLRGDWRIVNPLHNMQYERQKHNWQREFL